MVCLTRDKSSLGFIGFICTLIGGIIIFIIGLFLIFIVITNAFSETELYNYRLFPLIGFDNTMYGILYSTIGLLIIVICKNVKIYQHNKELVLGISFILLGLIIETIGGLIIIFGGILLLIDYII